MLRKSAANETIQEVDLSIKKLLSQSEEELEDADKRRTVQVSRDIIEKIRQEAGYAPSNASGNTPRPIPPESLSSVKPNYKWSPLVLVVGKWP